MANRNGIWQWDAFVCEAQNINVVVSLTANAVWTNDTAPVADDDIVTITETTSFSFSETATRLVWPAALPDVLDPLPWEKFRVFTGYPPQGAPPPGLPHFRNRRATIDSMMKWEQTMTTTVVTNYFVDPDDTDTYTGDAVITLEAFATTDGINDGVVQWSFNISNYTSFLEFIDTFNEDVIVNPFTLKAGGLVNFGFTVTDTGAAPPLGGFTVTSETVTFTVTVTATV